MTEFANYTHMFVYLNVNLPLFGLCLLFLLEYNQQSLSGTSMQAPLQKQIKITQF